MTARQEKPGSGKAFARLVRELEAKGYSEKSSKAIAATIGREKYGNKQMAKWAAEGRRRHQRQRHRNPRGHSSETNTFNQKGIFITLGIVGAAFGAAYLLTRKKGSQSMPQAGAPTNTVRLPSTQTSIRVNAT